MACGGPWRDRADRLGKGQGGPACASPGRKAGLRDGVRLLAAMRTAGRGGACVAQRMGHNVVRLLCIKIKNSLCTCHSAICADSGVARASRSMQQGPADEARCLETSAAALLRRLNRRCWASLRLDVSQGYAAASLRRLKAASRAGRPAARRRFQRPAAVRRLPLPPHATQLPSSHRLNRGPLHYRERGRDRRGRRGRGAGPAGGPRALLGPGRLEESEESG